MEERSAGHGKLEGPPGGEERGERAEEDETHSEAAELETPRTVLMETQGTQPSLVLWSTSSMVRPKARLNRPC